MDAHRIFGEGLFEIVYKEAIEYEVKKKMIPYKREKKDGVEYQRIVEEHVAWAKNQLAIFKCSLGLILNIGENLLVAKMVIL